MMRKVLLVFLGVLALPVLALAVVDCPTCQIGIWDNQAMTANCGTVTSGPPGKDVYIGVNNPGAETGVTGLELSIAGLGAAIVTGVQSLVPGATIIGSSIAA